MRALQSKPDFLLAGILTSLLIYSPAQAFEEASHTIDKIILTDQQGQIRQFSLSLYAGATSFSDFRFSPTKRFAGWEIEENAIPNIAPIPLSLVIVGPTTELRIVGDQAIQTWGFHNTAVRVCFGPMHNSGKLMCRSYRLPE